MKKIEESIFELNRDSKKYQEIGPKLRDEEIESIESKLNLTLPNPAGSSLLPKYRRPSQFEQAFSAAALAMIIADPAQESASAGLQPTEAEVFSQREDFGPADRCFREKSE